MDSTPSKYSFDAFISYSRRDIAFAKALETALENFRPPKDVSVRHQNLEIFRDESDFTGTAYHESIERHLQLSAMLIVICSPNSAQSPYVADEIERFVGSDRSRGSQIIPILYRGIPNNEAEPHQEKEKAFPPALYNFMEMPLGINYLGFDTARHKPNKGAYSNSWYALLANICNISRAEIEERERHRQSRRRRLQAILVSTVFSLLSIALVVTLISRQQAVNEREIAEQRRQQAVKSAEAERVAREEAQHQRGIAEQQTVEAEAQRNIAVQQQKLSESGQLSANAINVLPEDPQLSLLLGVESAVLSYSANHTVSIDAQDALHRALEASRERLSISVDKNGVHAVSFSPNRRMIATGGTEGIQFWDSVSGSRLFRIDDIGSVLGLAFNRDGSRLAMAGQDGTTRLWDTISRRELRRLNGHIGHVWSVVFSPDGTQLATAGADGTARVWDVASGQELHRMKVGHADVLYSVAFSPDGKLLAAGGEDGSTRIWLLASGNQLHELVDEGPVHSVTFSPDGKNLATVTISTTTVKIWDVISGREVRTFGDHASSVFAVAYSPDGSKLVTASIDKTARLWDPATGKRLFVFRGHTGLITCAAFSNDGDQIVTGAEDGTARVWSVNVPSERPPLVGHTAGVNDVAFSPDGNRIATASDDNTARIWLASTGRELRAFKINGFVNAISFSPDGKRLAVAGSDGTGRVFDAVSGAELSSLTGHRDEVKSIVYSHDGKRIATGSSDGTARIWDASSGKALTQITSRSGKVFSVDLNRDGKRVAIAIYADRGNTGDGAQIWDIRSSSALQNLDADYVWVNQVHFSPDGTRLVTTGSTPPYLVKEWDAASGRELVSFSGHTGEVLAATYSPDGTKLASGGLDSKIKVWDSASGREFFSLSLPNVSVNSIAFSPDGKSLASAGTNREVDLFATDSTDLLVLAASRLSRTFSANECQLYLRRGDCSTATSSKIVAGKDLKREGHSQAAMTQFDEAFAEWDSAESRSLSKHLLSELFMMEMRDRVKVGDVAGATAAFRAATGLVPLDGTDPSQEVACAIAVAKIGEAKQLGRAGKWTEEIALLKGALALNPQNESGYLALAGAYDNTREYDKAVAAMRSSVKISPTVSNLIDLADDLRLIRDYSSATAELNRAITTNPRSERAHRVLGLVFADLGEGDKALKEFTTAITISPTKYAYYEQARIYESRKSFPLALEALKKAKAIDSNYVAAYQEAARIYHEELSDFEAGFHELATARRLAPDDVPLQADFAEACLTAGRFQVAIDSATGLLDSPMQSQELSASDRLAIRFVKVAALELNGNIDLAAKEQQALIEDFDGLPKYEQAWTYTGTRRFLTNFNMDTNQRSALLALLDKLDARNGSAPKR
ncbi:MAG TPA: TIR domain-containing protein [Terracidiphilus sp.]|jgi:WD40 repeat protein